MPEPAAPFAVDPGTAARALVPAESAARNAPGPRPEPPGKHLRLASFGASTGETSGPAASGVAALMDRMDGLIVAAHGSPGASATVRLAAGARPSSGS